MDERGVASPVSVILILGLSLAVITVSVAAGSAVLSDANSDAEISHVENAMSQLSSEISLVALGETDSQQFRLGGINQGQIETRENTGNITVIIERENESDEITHQGDLGEIVYTNDDVAIAFQGGGVWRLDDENSTMVSPPEYYYRSNTLTFPIVKVVGDDAAGGPVSGHVSSGSVTPVYPASENPLSNGTVVVEVQSEYYQGWYRFFSERAAGSTTIDHANKTVRSELTIPKEVEFQDALAVREDYQQQGNAAEINGGIQENADYPSADQRIQNEIEDAKDQGAGAGCLDDSGDCTLDNGTYYYDGDLTLDGDLYLNTSEGDIDIIIDGDFDLKGNDVKVTDEETDNTVSYFVNGSFGGQGGAYLGVGDKNDPVEADRNVIYVGDQLFDDSVGDGTIHIEGIVYAPDADAEIGGNPTIKGVLITNSLEVNGNVEITYHDSIDDVVLELTGEESLITYLHVSENEVVVEFD